MKKNKDEYYVDFKGARLTKLEANRIGVGIVFGIIGIVLLFFIPVKEKGILSYVLIVSFVFVGYFLVAPRIFKYEEKK